MVYVTGDTHGEFGRIASFCKKMKTTKEDIMIILGDSGINYFEDNRDIDKKEYLQGLPITVFCIHGNHEKRASNIVDYKEAFWHGGAVYIEAKYPNIIFAKDGELFDFKGKRTLVIGGAYSIDKSYRRQMGYGWWSDEQPSEKIKNHTENTLKSVDWKVDVVLSHTCPYKYEPTEVFLPGVAQRTVDKTTEVWLGSIESRLRYKEWYCGHFHVTKQIDKLRMLFNEITVL